MQTHFDVNALGAVLATLCLSMLAACTTAPADEVASSSQAAQTAIYESRVQAGQVSIDPLYSVAPQKRAVYDNNAVLFQSIRLHDWMDRHHRRFAEEEEVRRQRARAKLYNLIDSRAKYIYQQEGTWVLPSSDPVLSMLFYWVDELDIHGGELLVNALEPTQYADPKSHTKTTLPEHFTLELHDGLFRLASRDDWSVRYPYSFMLWQVGATRDEVGLPIEIVTLSTGAARDDSELGHSKASLLVVHYPSKRDENAAERLVRYGGESGAAVTRKTLGEQPSQYIFDHYTNLHKEAVTVPLETGQLVIVYSGRDGSYQWNRPHFADFLKNLSAGPG